MNAQILVHAVVQQTTVLLAQLATAGRLRTPLHRVSQQVFLDLSAELQSQGLTKSLIADMFGMTLRTYHRKVHELSQSRSVLGRTVWEAVLEFIVEHECVSAAEIDGRFSRDDRDVVASILVDLVESGFCYRTGRGKQAVYRAASVADFREGGPSFSVACEYLVWQTIYRNGPSDLARVESLTRLPREQCRRALDALLADGRAERVDANAELFQSQRIDVPVGQAEGWEAAIFDHYQAMVAAVCDKLARHVEGADSSDTTGGATYSIDLWPGHPLEEEVLGTLTRVRTMMEDLRSRVDKENGRARRAVSRRLVFYVGQHLKSDDEGAHHHEA